MQQRRNSPGKSKRDEDNRAYRSDRSPVLESADEIDMMITETLIRRKRGSPGNISVDVQNDLSPVQLRRKRSERVRLQREEKMKGYVMPFSRRNIRIDQLLGFQKVDE